MTDGIYMEISLQKPSINEILQYLKNICQKEEVTVSDNILENCISHCSHDIRKVITFVQELSQYSKNCITQSCFESFIFVTQKVILHQNLFEMTSTLFTIPQTPVDCSYAYQTDTNLVPLMLHENLSNQLKYKKISSLNVVKYYAYLIQHLSLLSCLKYQTNNTHNDIIPTSGSSTRISSYHELAYPYSSLCCYEVNHIASKLSNKSGTLPLILFTNSLTKSATYSTSHNFFSLMSNKVNMNSSYFIYAVPVIVKELTTIPECVLSLAYNTLDYHDVDKIVQIYQKYNCCDINDININTKSRRIWRKMKPMHE